MAKKSTFPLIDLQADLSQLTPDELSAWRDVLTISWPVYKAVTLELARTRAHEAPRKAPGAAQRGKAGKITE